MTCGWTLAHTAHACVHAHELGEASRVPPHNPNAPASIARITLVDTLPGYKTEFLPFARNTTILPHGQQALLFTIHLGISTNRQRPIGHGK